LSSHVPESVAPPDPQHDAAGAVRAAGIESAGFNAGLLAAMEALQMAFAIKDARSLKYVQINAAMARMVGSNAKEMLGKSDAECFDVAIAQ
jgi:PAS domain-containing protein